MRRVLLVAATSRRTIWLFTKEGRIGITASECDACVIGEHFPRPARNGKQNKRRARSRRRFWRVALVWSILAARSWLISLTKSFCPGREQISDRGDTTNFAPGPSVTILAAKL